MFSAMITNMSAALDLMLGRERGLDRLDVSADGFWFSFIAIPIVGCINVLASFAGVKTVDGPPPDTLSHFLPSLIAIVAYGGSMVALYLLCNTPDTKQRFPIAVVAHNWAAPVITLALLPLSLLSVALSGAGTQLTVIIGAGILAALVIVGIRLLRLSLTISQSQAIFFFFVTAFVSVVLELGLPRLFAS